jgi:hypothetical protein
MHIPLVAGLEGGGLSQGNFGARIVNGRLVLPAELMAVLRQFGARSAVDFVGALQTHPRAFRLELKWQAKDVTAATRTLLQLLSSAVPGVPWRGSPPRKRMFGARPATRQKRPDL